MRIKLESDFRDYYDSFLDTMYLGRHPEEPHETLVRHTTGGMRRREMLDHLKELGYTVPAYGKVSSMMDSLGVSSASKGADKDDVEALRALGERVADTLEVVVVTDETAHRGEAKLKMSYSEALSSYPDALGVEYILDRSRSEGFSYRYLQIGDLPFWLQYCSLDDWRSNCGDVDVRVLARMDTTWHPHINLPLFSIDFVSARGRLYALDFNVAPGVDGTGVESLLGAKDASEALRRWFARQHGEM